MLAGAGAAHLQNKKQLPTDKKGKNRVLKYSFAKESGGEKNEKGTEAETKEKHKKKNGNLEQQRTGARTVAEHDRNLFFARSVVPESGLLPLAPSPQCHG